MVQLAMLSKIVGCVQPIDTAGVARLGCHVNFSKFEHVTWIVSIGVLDNPCTITMLAGTNALGAGGVAMGFSYYLSTGGAPLVTEVASALVTVGVGGYAFAAATDDNEVMVIEMDAAELVAPTTNYYVGPNFSNAATVALVSAVAICYWPRYAASPALTPSAIVA